MLGLGNALIGDTVLATATTPFTFTINTENAGSATKTFVLPLANDGIINMDVDWGDGSSDTISQYNQSEITHVYSSTGTYTIQISGTIRGWYFNYGGDKLKILDISQWGDFNFTIKKAFRGCTNLTSSATDSPTITETGNSLQQAFELCTAFNGAVNGWDVSSVTNMSFTFASCTNFNQDMSSWDVSNVTTMAYMFYLAANFNQDISSWNVSSVTTTAFMFRQTSFNQDIGSWNLSSITAIDQMFYGNTSFDQNLSSWDIDQVTNMAYFIGLGTLSTANYDALLIGWDAQSVQASQAPHFGNSTYTGGGAAAAARANLISSDSWTITDGGIA